VTGSGRDKSKSFRGPDAERQAKEWARDESARMRLGLSSRIANQSATEILVSDYLVDMASLGRTPKHVDDSRQLLNRAALAIPDLSAADAPKLLRAWLADLRIAPNYAAPATKVWPPVSPRTRNKYLIAVRSLCRWAMVNGRLGSDPTVTVREAKEPSYLRAQFLLDELRVMAQALDHPYHLFFVVSFYLGLRSSEAAKLRWDDFDESGRVWLVRQGKGAKDRLAHVPDEAVWLIRSHRLGRGHLFPGPVQSAQAGQHQKNLARFCASLSIPIGDRSPHSLRHSHAGVMTATGQPSLLLAAHLGHVSAQTTALYVKAATRYVAGVAGWRRGQIELLTGWSSHLPRGHLLKRTDGLP
jgi:integrase